MNSGEILVSLLGLVAAIASTGALIISNSTSEALKSLSSRIGNIEKVLIERALVRRDS